MIDLLTIIINKYMQLTNALTKIGLTEKQAKVYLACLELGGAGVSDISRKAKVERTTCYHILNDLINLGLISKSKQKKAGFFVAEDPRNIEEKSKENLRLIQNVLPELQAIHNVLPQKPKISFHEGWEGAKFIYEDTLRTSRPGDIILSYTSLGDYFDYIPKDWLTNYIKQRIEKKIRIKILTPASSIAKEYQKNDKQQLREIKEAEGDNWDFRADVQIYRNKVGIISFKENFMSVLIESKDIAQMQRMAFELMWKGANV